MLTSELLRTLSICSNLKDTELNLLCEILSKNSYKKILEPKQPLLQIGDETDMVFILENGLVRTVNYTDTGEEIFFYCFEKGRVINLLNVLSGSINTSQYIGVKRSELHCIPGENLRQALDEISGFTKQVLIDISNRSLELIQLMVISRRKKTRERILSYLCLHYQKTGNQTYDVPFTIELLARRLNLTRSALSKELHVLEKENLISISKNQIYIKEPEKLADSLFG